MEQLSLFDLAWIPSSTSDLRWFCPVCLHEHHSVPSLLNSFCPYCKTDHLIYDPSCPPISPNMLSRCVFLSVRMCSS